MAVVGYLFCVCVWLLFEICFVYVYGCCLKSVLCMCMDVVGNLFCVYVWLLLEMCFLHSIYDVSFAVFCLFYCLPLNHCAFPLIAFVSACHFSFR